MPFHRFQDPPYNKLGGSFPGTIGTQTYDRVNVTNGGTGGGGGSANADGAKSSGPNVGTYLVAFGEDATSSAANRGFRAVTQNTDALDNIVRGSVPYINRVSITTPVSSVDVAIPVEMFVGESGLAASSSIINSLVHIENTDGTAVYGSSPSGNQPVVTLIHDGTGVNVVGTAADGFYATATVRFANPIPAGTYVFFLGSRTSYADLLETKLHYLINEIIANRGYNTENWASFTQGLDEKYRRATTRSSAALNTPGSGATISRDGIALTISLVEHAWATPAAGADPFDAGIIVQLPYAFGTPGSATDYDRTLPGNIGYVYATNRRGSANASEYTHTSQPLAALAVLNPQDIHSSAVGTATARTFIPEGVGAVLNPSGSNANYVQVTTPNYFRDPTSETTAILCGFDGLLITVAGITQWWIIDSIVDDHTVSVLSPGGLFASFSTATAATIQWVQFSCCLGGAGLGWGGDDVTHHWSGFTWSDPMRLRRKDTDWPAVGYQEDPPTYIASDSTQDVMRAYAFNEHYGSHALGWHLTAGGVFKPGSFNDITPAANYVGGNFFKVNQGLLATVSVLTNGYNIVPIDIWAASLIWMTVSPAATAEVAATISVDTSTSGGSNPNYLATFGDHIEVYLDTRPNTSQIILLQWNALQFAFSEGDDQVPTGVAAVYKWTGTMGADGRFYMTRTDYNS